VIYRFGAFIVDRDRYRVQRDEQPVDLTPKLLDLLLFLVEHAAALVTKEQLLDALWPDANVTENALAQAMSELRDALGDDPGKPQFIKTIARRGYRFIAAVETIATGPPIEERPAGDGRPPNDEPAAGPAARPSRDDRAIAVLDFANVTGDAESAWLSAGIAETVTGDLRDLGHFRVIDRWRVMEAVRRTDGSLHQIAADLHARMIVVGSFQRNGGRIRITARAVDVVSGEAVADAKVDGPIDTIFRLQDDVVAQFSAELGVGASARGGGSESVHDTASLDAYRAFSEGWLRLESLDVRSIPQAIADFERAVAADPRYALAYTGLASAELAQYETTRSDNVPAQNVLDRAVKHARHAVGLDDSLAEAHATLALVLVSSWQTAEAAVAARRAVAIEPSNWRHLFRLGHASWGHERVRTATRTLAVYPDFAFAHFQMAMVHVARGRVRDAEALLRQGAAVQDRQICRGGRYPALGLHWLLGLVRLAQDDVDEAIAEFDRELALAEPHRLYGREYAMAAQHGRGSALLRTGRTPEAIAAFERALALYPRHGPTHLGLARARAAAGDRPDLSAVEQAVADLAGARPIESALVRAQMLATVDEVASIDTLRSMLDAAPPGFAGWTIPVEPFLRELHRSAGFASILSRLAERAR
jgi:DNA-binding winged helix-turn-helix (wHTH) protein/Flp pilus assembly protein TadD